MHLYTEMINFEGLDSYVDSLRLFLGGFRLPGEAQKIDRLMEKFAGTWFERNPKNGIFASADAAYVLAYSIIMLTTDLHSTKIKKKMTLEEFINNNRGINDGNSLPPDYLTSVYAAIEKEEIKMKGPQTVKVAASDIKSSKDRKKYFEEQMRDLAGNAEDQMKAAETSNAVFLRAHQVHFGLVYLTLFQSCCLTYTVNVSRLSKLDQCLRWHGKRSLRRSLGLFKKAKTNS